MSADRKVLALQSVTKLIQGVQKPPKMFTNKVKVKMLEGNDCLYLSRTRLILDNIQTLENEQGLKNDNYQIKPYKSFKDPNVASYFNLKS